MIETLVRDDLRNGLRALTLITRLISSRLTPKWPSAATSDLREDVSAPSPRSGAIAAPATTAAIASTEAL